MESISHLAGHMGHARDSPKRSSSVTRETRVHVVHDVGVQPQKKRWGSILREPRPATGRPATGSAGSEHMKTKTMNPKKAPAPTPTKPVEPSSPLIVASEGRQSSGRSCTTGKSSTHQRLGRPDVYDTRFCDIQPSLATCQHLASASTCSASHRVHGVCWRVAKSRQVRWRPLQVGFVWSSRRKGPLGGPL